MAELIPNASIKQFTTNNEVVGAYAEASDFQFVARVVDPALVRLRIEDTLSEQYQELHPPRVSAAGFRSF